MQAGGRRFDPVRLHQGVETTGRIIAEGIPIGSSRLCEARLRRHGFVVSGISIVLCQCEEVGAFLDVPLFGLSDPYGAIHALRMTGHGQKRVECSVSKDRVVRRLLRAWDLSYLRRFGVREHAGLLWVVSVHVG